MSKDIGHWECEFEFDTDEWFGFVYRIINLVDSREYIGKKQFHKTNRKIVKGRKNRKKVVSKSNWKSYTSSSKYINEDIEKYGKDIFVFVIESLHKTKGSLHYREVEVQVKENVLREKMPDGTNKYYNRNIAAVKFIPIDEHSEETKHKISIANIGKNHSEETKHKISLSTRGKNNHNYGKIGKDSIHSKKVVQIDKKTHQEIAIWDSASDVARYISISQSSISACCMGKVKTAGGYFWCFHGDVPPEYQTKPHLLSKKVVQIDKKTHQEIAIWDSMREVERELKIRNNAISECCKNKRKTAGGFIWKYA